MRTTLTLDDDVAARLEALRRKRGVRFRDLVNETLRRGLDAPAHKPRPIRGSVTRSVDLGPCLVASLDKLHDVLDEVEGPWHK
ncbi:MAG TPA: CopG family transcriptional regulator [Kiritimatiellia bacterium]|nr:CopG family transcriptional regulator [Kiritimatiellia bacterium]